MEWREDSVAWREDSLEWREDSKEWREDSKAWREESLEWREDSKEWREDSLEWREESLEGREDSKEWREESLEGMTDSAAVAALAPHWAGDSMVESEGRAVGSEGESQRCDATVASGRRAALHKERLPTPDPFSSPSAERGLVDSEPDVILPCLFVEHITAEADDVVFRCDAVYSSPNDRAQSNAKFSA